MCDTSIDLTISGSAKNPITLENIQSISTIAPTGQLFNERLVDQKLDVSLTHVILTSKAKQALKQIKSIHQDIIYSFNLRYVTVLASDDEE